MIKSVDKNTGFFYGTNVKLKSNDGDAALSLARESESGRMSVSKKGQKAKKNNNNQKNQPPMGLEGPHRSNFIYKRYAEGGNYRLGVRVREDPLPNFFQSP